MRYRQSRAAVILKWMLPVVLVALIFALVSIRTSVTSMEYKLSSLEKTKSEAQREQKVLVAQKAGLMALTRVEGSEMAGLGFSFPERKKVVYVRGSENNAPYKVSLNTQR